MMKEFPKAVLFDFNGTIIDMATVVEQDIHVAREEFGVALTPKDVLDSWGSPPETTYPKLFGRRGSTLPWTEMRAKFQSYDDQFPRRLLPGVLSVITMLESAGIVRGIITSSQHERVLKYMQQGGLEPNRLDFIHADREFAENRLAGRPILTHALGECALRGITPSQIVFVGDEAVTIHDADECGVRPVIVASGTISMQRLLEQGVPPDKIIRTMHELPEHLGLNT